MQLCMRFSFPCQSSVCGSCSLEQLLKHHVHYNKHNSLVNEVELIKVNPHYALVQYSVGRQAIVSLRNLTLSGNESEPVTAQKEEPVLYSQLTEKQPYWHCTLFTNCRHSGGVKARIPTITTKSNSEFNTSSDD